MATSAISGPLFVAGEWSGEPVRRLGCQACTRHDLGRKYGFRVADAPQSLPRQGLPRDRRLEAQRNAAERDAARIEIDEPRRCQAGDEQ